MMQILRYMILIIIIYKEDCKIIFGSDRNSFQYASIFKLNTNEDNYYIISFSAQNSSNRKLFYLIRFYFQNLEIYNALPSTLVMNEEIAETTI